MNYHGIEITLLRKPMRSIRLSVKPDGRVVLSAPLLMPDSRIFAFLDEHLDWLQRQQNRLHQLAEEHPAPQYVSGEKHLLWGRWLPLRIEPERGRESVAFYPDEIVLFCHPDSTPAQRKKLLYQGYYQQFRPVLDDLLQKWETRLNQEASGLFPSHRYSGFAVSVRLMKTEWGSCTPAKRRMTFNVDMARLPRECMEYVVIHEFTHIDHCNHSPAFWALCDSRLALVGLPDSRTMRRRIRAALLPPADN